MTFGYNGSFLKSSTRNSVTVLDFAKDLLYDLKYAKDENKTDLRIGDVLIFFLRHLRLTDRLRGSYHLLGSFNGRPHRERS